MKREYLIASLIALIVLVLGNAYLFMPLLQPKPGMYFLERRVMNSQDTYTYVAFIEQARQGRLLFENLYTTEPQTATLMRPSYTVLGVLAHILGVSSIGAYHLGRILFSILFFFVLYKFLGLFFKTPKRRLFAFAVVLTSCGVGYMLSGIFPDSADLWIPEANTFLSLQEAPHFILSQTLMLLSFLFILKGWGKRKNIYFLFSFLVLFYLGFEHPYDLLIMVSTSVLLGIYLWLKKKLSVQTVLYGVGSTIIPFILCFSYQYVETLRNPTLGSWAAQSTTPIPLYFITGFGFLLVFVPFGLEKYLRRQNLEHLLIAFWAAVTILLLYAPVFFQRRLSEAIHIPIAIMAAEGILVCAAGLARIMIPRVRKATYYFFVILSVGFLAVGTQSGISTDVNVISADVSNKYYYYLLDQEKETMDYIKAHSSFQDVILSNWFYGNIIPGLTGRKVFIGHKAQTKNFDQKVKDTNTFILNKDTKSAYRFLKENHITFMFIGKDDTILAYGFKANTKPFLTKVFEKNGAVVYRVK